MTKPPVVSKSKKTQSKGGKKNVASSNWFNLQKTLKAQDSEPVPHRKKRQKLDSGKPKDNNPSSLSASTSSSLAPPISEHAGSSTSPLNNLGLGRYIALDCEMVGVGIDGSQSSLARVSLVNYHGAVIMDEYVQQRERVVDYRTPWSGITALNMINAKPFDEVQKKVNDLLDGRVLIGHAVHHDLKALLLSHPIRRTRDTQFYAYKYALSKKSRHISLKILAKQELGINIQDGEHSSVVDAKATMAIYRKHKDNWEKASGSTSQIREPKRKWSTQIPETNDLLESKDEGERFSEVEGEE